MLALLTSCSPRMANRRASRQGIRKHATRLCNRIMAPGERPRPAQQGCLVHPRPLSLSSTRPARRRRRHRRHRRRRRRRRRRRHFPRPPRHIRFHKRRWAGRGAAGRDADGVCGGALAREKAGRRLGPATGARGERRHTDGRDCRRPGREANPPPVPPLLRLFVAGSMGSESGPARPFTAEGGPLRCVAECAGTEERRPAYRTDLRVS